MKANIRACNTYLTMVMLKMVVVGLVFVNGTTNPLRKFSFISFILFLNGVCRFYGPRTGGYAVIVLPRNLRVIF